MNKQIEEKIKELNQQDLNDAQIGRIIGFTETKTNIIRRKLNLPLRQRNYISDKDLINAINENLTYKQISEKYNVSDSQIRRHARKLNLEVYIEKEDFDNKIISLVKKGKNIKEIQKALNLKRTTRIYDSLKRSGLYDDFMSKYKKTTHISNINESEFLDLYNLGYTNSQLSEYFQVSISTIQKYRKTRNLPVNRKSKILNIDSFTNEEFQVLYGSLLGDAYLGIRRKNIYGSMGHCLKQKGFLDYKLSFLKRFSSESRIITCFDSRFKNSEYKQVYAYIKSSKALNNLYPFVYNNRIKYIHKDYLYKLNGLGVAIWYMDDGSKPKYGGYILCTNCFSRSELELIQNFFLDKFNIKTTIRKNNILYIKAESKNLFKNLVMPYMEKSMLYKL